VCLKDGQRYCRFSWQAGTHVRERFSVRGSPIKVDTFRAGFSPCRKCVVMSSRRNFSNGFNVDDAHPVIDSGRSVAEVARKRTFGGVLVSRWVGYERA
jgi:hypothetical protein